MKIKLINLLLIITVFLFSCNNTGQKLNDDQPEIHMISKTKLFKSKPNIDTVKFRFNCSDTLDLRLESIKKYDYKKILCKLTDKDKRFYFQRFYNQFKTSELYFFAHLKCNVYIESMVFLDIDKTTYHLVEIGFRRSVAYYPRSNLFNHTDWVQNTIDRLNISGEDIANLLLNFYSIQNVDTMLSSFKNGLAIREEYASIQPEGYLSVNIINKTQINQSTLLIDTLKNGAHINSIILNSNNLKQRYSIRNIIPKGKNILSEAKGDLNGDGIDDYALILQDNDDDGGDFRDLLIVFTTPQGFKIKTFINGCFSCKHCGGFSDPIAGINIVKHKLIIKYYEGSAWKTEGASKFSFSNQLNDFFLVQEKVRSYHSLNIYENESELPHIEKVRKGIRLNKEEQEEYEYAKKGLEDYKFQVTNYRIGKKPIAIALKNKAKNY